MTPRDRVENKKIAQYREGWAGSTLVVELSGTDVLFRSGRIAKELVADSRQDRQ